ncbi:DMT family transporter [Candidatus Woesearchaeota archaeon]|nr:DMT family transporter [Candidatus Woesearchaeota archaeon]
MMLWAWFALGAATAVVVRDLAHKKALNAEHALEMVVSRSFFLVPLLFILGFAIDTELPLGTLALVYLVSLIATAGILFRIKGLRHMDVGQAAPLQNINPLFLLLIAALLLGEVPTVFQLVGILLIVFGTYIIEGSDEYPGILGPLKHLKHDKFAWLIILSAFVLSISQTFDKWLISSGVDPFVYFFWIWLFINLNFMLIHFAKFKWHGLKRDVVRDWKWLGIAAGALFIQMLCYYKAISLGPVSLVMPINRLSALGLVIIGGKLLHEDGMGRRVLAVSLMVIGAILILI